MSKLTSPLDLLCKVDLRSSDSPPDDLYPTELGAGQSDELRQFQILQFQIWKKTVEQTKMAFAPCDDWLEEVVDKCEKWFNKTKNTKTTTNLQDETIQEEQVEQQICQEVERMDLEQEEKLKQEEEERRRKEEEEEEERRKLEEEEEERKAKEENDKRMKEEEEKRKKEEEKLKKQKEKEEKLKKQKEEEEEKLRRQKEEEEEKLREQKEEEERLRAQQLEEEERKRQEEEEELERQRQEEERQKEEQRIQEEEKARIAREEEEECQRREQEDNRRRQEEREKKQFQETKMKSAEKRQSKTGRFVKKSDISPANSDQKMKAGEVRLRQISSFLPASHVHMEKAPTSEEIQKQKLQKLHEKELLAEKKVKESQEQKKKEIERKRAEREERIKKAEEYRKKQDELVKEKLLKKQGQQNLASLQKHKDVQAKLLEQEKKRKELSDMKKKQEAAEKLRREKEEEMKKEEENLQKALVKNKVALNVTYENQDTAETNGDLNSTYTKQAEGSQQNDPESYDITPARHELPPEPLTNPDNYDIQDLKSDEETDDEDQPRKVVPSWAMSHNFREAIYQQGFNPPDLDLIFAQMDMPDLSLIFKQQRKRFYKRTSSAQWGAMPRSYQV